MWHVWVLLAAVCVATAAGAQCQPSGRATFATGLEALDRGDLSAAAAAFETLVRTQTDCAEARNNLAVVLVEQGRLREAAEQLHRAVELQPDYHRARLNLERVETLLAARPIAARPVTTPPAQPAVEVERPPAAEARPTASPVPTLAPAPTAVPTPASTVPSPPVPPSIAVLEPEGRTAAVIEAAQNRICVYRKAAEGLVRDACYTIVTARLGADVRWLTASDLTPKRIRLVDETGRKRLKIVGGDGTGGADVVQLRAADFSALSAVIVAWRTGWVVLDQGHEAQVDGAAIATDVGNAIERWRQAWEQKQIDDYFAAYSASFVPQGEPDVAHWRTRKRRLFEQGGALSVQVRAPNLFVLDEGTVIATFEQSYRAGANASVAVKAVRWQRDGTRWTISAETVLNETVSP
jgi:tetratricopeptide (TPR) repeat protein